MNTTSAANVSINDDGPNVTMPLDDVGESRQPCYLPVYYIKLVTLAIAMSMMTVTLILIPCHRRLRRQHHIFPYNLVLSDMSGAIVFACFEGFGSFEPPEEAYMFLVILLASSQMVSLLSIVLVTGYQFITIRVDPFGSRNIITTPRLIMTCVVTWAISFAFSSPISLPDDGDNLFIVLLSLSWATTIATGLCYIFIYRSVAKVPCGGNITQERKEENQRVLRTFGLVFGTTVFCWICPWVTWTLQVTGYENSCLINAGDTMININWIANSVIYWWRLKEFQSMFGFCRRRTGTVDPQLSLVTDLK